jgi:diacylglycerol kinase (ATP)
MDAPSPKPPAKGLLRFAHTLRYSWRGLRAAWRHEESFRQEAIIALILIPPAAIFGGTLLERLLLCGSLILLLLVELINSALETLVDRIGPEQHELSGRAKDMGSAAVMLAILLAFTCWCTLLIPRFL